MKTISRDGTAIAYERSGQGPALILVDGALCSRTFGPMPKLAPLLAQHFTVYMYDRRGRGESADTEPYSYEPPFVGGNGRRGGADHEAELRRLLAAGNRGDAVKYFMRDMVGAPAPMIVMMQLMPWIWSKLKAVAHTLPYDAAVMSGFEVPTARLASIQVPTLVLHGSKTDARLQKAARAVADAVPGAQHRTLAGQTHNVKPAAPAPAVVEFFTA